MPAFSYAQAARGLPQSKSEPLMRDESTEHEVQASQLEENNASRGSSRPSRGRARDESNEGADATEKELPTISTDEVEQKESVVTSKQPRQGSTARKSSDSSTTSPNSTTGDAATRLADSASRRDQSSSWDQTSQTSTSIEKAAELTDKDKVKDSEDDWEKVSVPSVSAEKELKAAPVPTVNIWLQRKEAQDAKKRQVEPQRASVPNLPSPGSTAKPTTDELKTKSSGRETQDKAAARKSAENEKTRGGQDPSPIQASKSASRPDGKSEVGVPPSVADTMSWPTPENSLVEERRRSNANEKAEKTERVDNRKEGAKTHSKWVQIPFVPTAKFETPLPPAAGKRGGRAGRGRGGHMPQGIERSEPTGAMGPPPLPNKAAEQDRGRKNGKDRSTRANSLPAANRRPTSQVSTIANMRKPSAPSKDNPILHTPASSSKVSPTDPTSGRSQTPSRSSSRPGQATVPGYGTATHQSTADTMDVFTDSAMASNGRPAPFPERAQLPLGSSRPQGDYVREGRSQKTRDWSRDKTDAVNATEKVENWKDRDYSGDPNSRRGERSERGRGSFRGSRGGHSYNSFSSNHAYTSPLPQNGFEVPKHGAGPADRSRQASQPYPFTTAAPNRSNPRSYSGPLNAGYQGVYYDNNTGMAQAMSPIQTDMSGYNLQGQMPMLSSPMSAAPFGSHLSSFGVMSMVMGQVEYYFSIDNLCKDLFLRKHMDSQGWVPLSMVAGFKRIKTLIEDSQVVDTLRYVCPQIRTIEYLPGGDEGEDRLRRRDNWQDFVLPMSERLPSAQNDGPQSRQPSMPQLPNLPQFYGKTTPFVPQHLRSPSATMPGVNGTRSPTSPTMSPPPPIPSLDGHISDRQNGTPYSPSRAETGRRESAVSPFSPHDFSALQATPLTPQLGGFSSMTNGHRRQSSRNTQDENVFPDERLAEINICVKSPVSEEKSEEQSLLSGVSRVLSNGSEATGPDHSTVSIPPRVTGMRGGAGHPDQLARLQHVQFGSQPLDVSEQTPFYAKDGQRTSIPPSQPGQFFVSYSTFRDNAMQDRARGLPEAMEPMYNFWEKFLIDNFNAGLYDEFRDFAQEDAAQGNDSGNRHLYAYYHSALECSKPMLERVAADLVSVLRNEQGEARPMFKIMRQAWRNGALDMKTRKRLADLLSVEERAAFDRGG